MGAPTVSVTPEQKYFAFTKWLDGMYHFRTHVLQRQGVTEASSTMGDWRDAVRAMADERRSPV